MADFVQTMKDWKRMCNAMGQEDEYTACDKCDLRPFGCPAMYENECNNADWNHVESVVTTWAAENPEPVYPAWRDWLRDLYGNPSMTMTDILESPIDPEIAQRLNIVPRRAR